MVDKEEPDEHPPGTTQDEQLLESPGLAEFTHTDTWRVFRIMGEFVEGFDELATLTRGISIFGSVYWGGLLGWIRDFAMKEGKVSEQDLKLLHVTDSPKEVVQIIVNSQNSLSMDNTLISEIADPYPGSTQS